MAVYRIAHGSCEIYLERLERRLQLEQELQALRRKIVRARALELAAGALFVALLVRALWGA